jgi:tankyrase
LWLNFDLVNFIDPPSGSADVECQLLEAAKAGDIEQVQRLLTSYPQIVNCRDLDGRYVFTLHALFNSIAYVSDMD